MAPTVQNPKGPSQETAMFRVTQIGSDSISFLFFALVIVSTFVL